MLHRSLVLAVIAAVPLARGRGIFAQSRPAPQSVRQRVLPNASQQPRTSARDLDCAKRELREKQRILRATEAALIGLDESFAESAVTSVIALAIAAALATRNVSDADSMATALLALGLDKNLAAAASALAGSATPSALALQGGMKLLNLRKERKNKFAAVKDAEREVKIAEEFAAEAQLQQQQELALAAAALLLALYYLVAL